MAAKLDTGKAWADATRRMGANRELVLAVAGVFFFVPLMIMLMMLFGADFDFGPAGSEPDPEQISKQVSVLISNYWWAMLLVALGQIAGGIAILALLGDPKKPTVGEVMGMIPKLMLTAIAAQIIATLASQALPSLTTLLPPSIGAALNLVALVISIYITVKFALTSAVIAIEKQANPIQALSSSWMLTRGNSFRIFVFYFLLVVTAIVVGLVVVLLLGLAFSLMGERVQMIGTAAVLSALIAGFYALAYAVSAAIYRQLSGPTSDEISKTFD